MSDDHLDYSIPQDDLPEFYSLPDDVQRDVRLALAILKRVNGAKGVQKRIRAEARALHGRRGFSPASINRKRALYRDSLGDWRVLVDGARAPSIAAPTLPPEFVEYWKSLVDENHRKIKPAWRKLLRLWQAGESVPGYGNWTEWFLAAFPGRPLPRTCPPDLPAGWSYRNLMRFKPSAAERALTQRGVNAARLELPTVIGTREGLRFMEWVVLDDWRSDFRVVDPRAQKAVQLNGILALDVSCALAMHFGVRPAIPRDDGTEEGLKRRDAKAVIAGILMTYGYPADYVCNIVVERGTATISPDDAAAVEEATGGHVKIHYTSMISGSVFGYADRPLGNFLGKAWLESYFNLTHNEAADIPGQIGARYDLAPQSTEIRMREAQALVKAGQFLPPEVRRELAYPFLDTNEARVSLEHVFRRLNHRDEHELEGFEQVMEWREARLEGWRPAPEALGMPREVQDLLEWRTRSETPWERYERLSRGVTFNKIHLDAMPRILEEHKRVALDKPGEIRLTIRGKAHIYQDLDNAALEAGAEFLAYYDGANPEWLHLTDGRGAYVGSLRETKGVRRCDHEALAEAIRAKQAQLNRTLSAVEKRNAPRLAGRLQAIEHNQKMLEEATADDEAISLVPAAAGEAGDAPVYAQAIDAVAQAQADIAEQNRRTEKRIAGTKGSLDDMLGPEPVAVAADAEDDFTELDQML